MFRQLGWKMHSHFFPSDILKIIILFCLNVYYFLIYLLIRFINNLYNYSCYKEAPMEAVVILTGIGNLVPELKTQAAL
jgi:hypothetical protein